MSDIAHIAGHLGSSTSRLARTERPESRPADTATAPTTRFGRSAVDAVEISADARVAASRPGAEPAPDMAKVARMKAAIAGGAYDSDARFQIAIDRMIDDVFA